MIFNKRTQQPVGQGGFHTAEVWTGSNGLDGPLRYVYDCGSTSRYTSAREREIDSYIATIGVGSTLHLLFLSHVHADHVNGVARLLHRKTGVRARSIVLPLLNVVERLIAFARTAEADPVAADDPFYQSFTVRPAAALAQFGPNQILFVERGSGDSAALPTEGGGGPPPGDGPLVFDPDASGNKEEPSWKLIGYEANRVYEESVEVPASEGEERVRKAIIRDTSSFVIADRSSSGTRVWILSPFVDPAIEASAMSFLRNLAINLKISTAVLAKNLRSPIWIERLLRRGRDELKYAYKMIAPDLNITSMCLYSGPAQQSPQGSHTNCGFGSWYLDLQEPSPISWLATGDADLKNYGRRGAMMAHYKRCGAVHTFVLPHHGSDHNFHVELLAAFQPSVCICAADAMHS